MKFSDINQQQWQELKPYLDTCILPVTGLNGSEEPWEATDALEQLRDLIDMIEVPFRGRVVSYPAYHYILRDQISENIEEICLQLRGSGFSYIVIASRGAPIYMDSSLCTFDLLLDVTDYSDMQGDRMKKDVHEKIVAMWNNYSSKANL